MTLWPVTRRKRSGVLYYWEWSRAKWQFDEFARRIDLEYKRHALMLPPYADVQADEYLTQLRVRLAINEQRQRTLIAATVLQPTWRDRWAMWCYEWATRRVLPRNRV